MSKGLEALKRIRQETCPATYNQDFDKEECCKIIEKELKVLEIIKREPVEVSNLIDTYETYEEMKQDYYAYGDEEEVIKNKNEFDLLKEVLL